VKAEAAAEAKLPHLRDPKMPVNTHQFFAIYYCMTGLHGIHVVIGMGMIAWLMWGAMLGRYDGNYYTPVDLGGLYWHIVDLIWIFLFPLFYLIH
jgi:cytochrome c oxidase subunit 3